MDPLDDLLIAHQRRAEFERRADEQRLVRSLRGAPSRPTITVCRRPSAAPTPLACCPA